MVNYDLIVEIIQQFSTNQKLKMQKINEQLQTSKIIKNCFLGMYFKDDQTFKHQVKILFDKNPPISMSCSNPLNKSIFEDYSKLGPP